MNQRAKQYIVNLLIVLTFFMIAFPYPSVAIEQIVLVGSEDTKASLTGRWLGLIYTEVFRRLGYELQYLGYPNERANVMAETGIVDGEIQRGANYTKTAQNLLRVEEPSFTAVVAAYAVSPGIVLDGWQSLKNTNYIVEYRRGSKVPQNALPTVVQPANLSAIDTVELGLKKLISGRTDIYIEQEPVVIEILMKFDKDNEFDLSSVYQAGIMWTGNSHLYLHKKHAELLPKISKVLKTMKQEGLVERYKEIAQKAQ